MQFDSENKNKLDSGCCDVCAHFEECLAALNSIPFDSSHIAYNKYIKILCGDRYYDMPIRDVECRLSTQVERLCKHPCPPGRKFVPVPMEKLVLMML